ncbi:cbb3-type cytochrome oxidase assembly protein CcoS [Flavobacteriaceae bacterium KMM 6897]|nr:cbb3-type cytochrome oxidase assembly protein CcoS [Flavobacteriaceae bacterium KMM 6897]MEB8346634.1 cbb3-type cytochrome oxidase assembly protein CcoS [Flavobacteriaceae bacterium KMM 6898]
MSVIYVLLTISIVIAVVFFAAFIFSVKNGQYDDTYTPSVRMLFEDELVKNPAEPETKKLNQPKENNQ